MQQPTTIWWREKSIRYSLNQFRKYEEVLRPSSEKSVLHFRTEVFMAM